MLRELERPAPLPPCARCGAPATSELWSHPTCGDCHAVWMASKRTLVGEVDAAMGITWVRGVAHAKGAALTSAEYLAASCEEYRRLARVWVHSAKREAGAA